jgi:hypothetical protein
MDQTSYLLSVRDKPGLVLAIMRALAGNATVSVAGHLLGCSLSAMPGVVMTRAADDPPDWCILRLPLEPGTIGPIWRVLSRECRWGSQILDVRIAKDGWEQFAIDAATLAGLTKSAYCGTAVPRALLEELKTKGVLLDYQAAGRATGALTRRGSQLSPLWIWNLDALLMPNQQVHRPRTPWKRSRLSVTMASSVNEQVRRLGTPTQTFKPGLANLIAGIIVGLVMMAVSGPALVAFIRMAMQSDPKLSVAENKLVSAIGFGLGGIFGLGLALGGIALIYWVRGMFSFRLYVCPEGFYYTHRGNVHVFRWEEIERVVETITQEYLPLKGIAKYAAPPVERRSYVIRRRDGFEFGFGPNSIRKSVTLGNCIRNEVTPRNIRWDIVHESFKV